MRIKSSRCISLNRNWRNNQKNLIRSFKELRSEWNIVNFSIKIRRKTIFVTIIVYKKKNIFISKYILQRTGEFDQRITIYPVRLQSTINPKPGTQLHPPGFTFTETRTMVLTRWNDIWSRSIRLGVPGTRTASPETSSPSCGGTRTWPWMPGRSADRSGNKGLGHLFGSNSAAQPPPRSYRCLWCRPCSSSVCTSFSSVWAPFCDAPRRIWAIETAWGRWNGGQARRRPRPSAPRCPPCPPSRFQAFSAPRLRTRGSAPRSAHPRSPGGPRKRRRRSNASRSASSIGPCFVEDSRCSHLDNFFFFQHNWPNWPVFRSSILFYYSEPIFSLFSLGFFFFFFSICTMKRYRYIRGTHVLEGARGIMEFHGANLSNLCTKPNYVQSFFDKIKMKNDNKIYFSTEIYPRKSSCEYIKLLNRRERVV